LDLTGKTAIAIMPCLWHRTQNTFGVVLGIMAHSSNGNFGMARLRPAMSAQAPFVLRAMRALWLLQAICCCQNPCLSIPSVSPNLRGVRRS